MKLTVFKSRRGRPSQYLQQALQLNSTRIPLTDMVQNNNNQDTSESKSSPPTLAPEVAKQSALTERATTDEMKENRNALQQQPKSVSSTMATQSQSPEHKVFMDNHGAPAYISTTTAPTYREKSQQIVDNMRATLGLQSPAPSSFCEKENRRDSAGISNTSSSSSGSETDMSRSPMSVCDSSVESSSSPEGPGRAGASPLIAAAPVETSTPLHPPPQPARRRPGRPPGSTKKRMQSYAEYKKRSDPNAQSADDFSLRKFFEAGGRDYNEYLDWLKKRQAQQNTTATMMSQVSSFPTLAGTVMPSMSGTQTVQTTHITPSSQYPPRATMYNGTKNPMVLPPPPYRPILMPRNATTALPAGVRLDSIPVSVSVSTYPLMHTTSPVSPTHTTQHHSGLPPPPPPPLRLPIPIVQQDSNALDLSAPTRKRRSEESYSSSSCDDDMPSPTTHNATKLFRDSSGSPVEIIPMSQSPHQHANHLPSSTAAVSPLHKPDINGNVPGGSPTDASDFVESTTEADISSWDVDSVVGFINSIPGCQEYSEVFREHRIDGTTLPHLSEEHLLNFVKMKLGPAIRLRLAIARLRPVAQ